VVFLIISLRKRFEIEKMDAFCALFLQTSYFSYQVISGFVVFLLHYLTKDLY